jgi:hypothetical protein
MVTISNDEWFADHPELFARLSCTSDDPGKR